MIGRTAIRTAVLACIALFAAAAGGCLISSSSTTYTSGTEVPPGTLSHVEPGVTTEAWLIATLGEPDSRSPVRHAEGEPRTEVLTYRHKETYTSRGKVFLLFRGSSRVEKSRSIHFEVRDGVVQRYWVDK